MFDGFQACDVSIDEEKVGDLVGISVYKFRMVDQLLLLSYRVLDASSIKLLTVGAHENFYRNLMRLCNDSAQTVTRRSRFFMSVGYGRRFYVISRLI